MDREIIEIIQTLISGFKDKGYTRLSRVIKDKLEMYLRNKNDRNWNKDVSSLESKKVLTEVLESIYIHVDTGISEALNQLKMLDYTGEVFNELNFKNEKVLIKYRKNTQSLAKIRTRYDRFQYLKIPLINMIKVAKKEGYLIESNVLKGVL